MLKKLLPPEEVVTQMILDGFASNVTAVVLIETRPAEKLGVLAAIIGGLLFFAADTALSITPIFHIKDLIKYYIN